MYLHGPGGIVDGRRKAHAQLRGRFDGVHFADDDVIYPPSFYDGAGKLLDDGCKVVGARYKILTGRGVQGSKEFVSSFKRATPFDGGTMVMSRDAAARIEGVAYYTDALGDDIVHQMLCLNCGDHFGTLTPPGDLESFHKYAPYHMRRRDEGRYNLSGPILERAAKAMGHGSLAAFEDKLSGVAT